MDPWGQDWLDEPFSQMNHFGSHLESFVKHVNQPTTNLWPTLWALDIFGSRPTTHLFNWIRFNIFDWLQGKTKQMFPKQTRSLGDASCRANIWYDESVYEWYIGTVSEGTMRSTERSMCAGMCRADPPEPPPTPLRKARRILRLTSNIIKPWPRSSNLQDFWP